MTTQHHKCSASWDYTHTIYPMSLRALNQKSNGKKMDSDPDSSSTTACVWRRNPQPSVASKYRRKEGERLEKLVSNQFILKKREPYPSLYRPRRGAILPS